jgi:hypothetical protein
MIDPENVRKRDAMAEFFRARGLNPLPSSDAEKKPLVRFREYWEAPAPADLFEQHKSACVQVMTGRHWRLLVIDLDGPAALAWWAGLPRAKPKTWVTHSGGGGQHWWFSLPENYPHPLPKAVLWADGAKHSQVDRLCDRSLVMAPPSIHPRTGKRYQFLDTWHSPARLPMPAMCPNWVLAMPDITPRRVIEMRPAEAVARHSGPVPGGRYRAEDVRAAIPDVIGLAASWGVKFTGRVRDGWHECRALDREDRNPSAAVNAVTGTYKDLGSGLGLGLFDLAAACGQGSDWREAVAILGERYRAREAG